MKRDILILKLNVLGRQKEVFFPVMNRSPSGFFPFVHIEPGAVATVCPFGIPQVTLPNDI